MGLLGKREAISGMGATVSTGQFKSHSVWASEVTILRLVHWGVTVWVTDRHPDNDDAVDQAQ